MAQRGFTLIELLVVLVVMGLVIAAAPSLINRGMPSLEVRAAAREIAAGMRRTRGLAILANRDSRFTVDTENKRYAIGDGRSWHALPERIGIEVETARSEVIDDTIAGLRFYPDGSTTGGRITVSNADRTYHVMLDWLTGTVSVVE